MNEDSALPFSDFSSRFRADLRQRPIYYILSGPTLAKSSEAIGMYAYLNPMIGTQNEVEGVLELLSTFNRPLDIWMNITATQDVYNWKTFIKLLSTPETGIILTPFVWQSHGHLMELERDFVIRHFHKVFSFDLSIQSLVSGIQTHDSVNSLTYFLFFAHMLEVKGPIFLFGGDGVSESGDVEGHEGNNHFGVTNLKHLNFDHINEERETTFLINETKGLNENWPVFEQWFERRNIRKIPIYNVSGAGYLKPFEFIEPEEIPNKIDLCDSLFDSDQRMITTGEYWDFATLQANVSRYDHFCSQFSPAQIQRRVIPFISEAAGMMKQTKDQTIEAMSVIMKLIMDLERK